MLNINLLEERCLMINNVVYLAQTTSCNLFILRKRLTMKYTSNYKVMLFIT